MLGKIKDGASTIKAANDMRKQQSKFQKMLQGITVTGSSKNGKVTVKVLGDQKIKDIKIDPELINFVHENFTSAGKDDTMLSKSIMEAVDDAMGKVQAEVVKTLQASGSMDDLMGMIKNAGSIGG